MTKQIKPGTRSGSCRPPVSKSDAHRRLLSAALSGSCGVLLDETPADDLLATVRCLRALGADIRETADENGRIFLRMEKKPETASGSTAELLCGESGTTFRFLLPVAAALGIHTLFRLDGRLPDRPVGELAATLEANGAVIQKNGPEVFLSGRLRPGVYAVPGNISSQFVSGLLFALPLLDGESVLSVDGEPVSAPYIALTEQTLSDCGIRRETERTGSAWSYKIPGNQIYRAPGTVRPEADWSGAAPFLCMGACSDTGILAEGLNENSLQGDKAILPLLQAFGTLACLEPDGIRVRRGRLTATDIDASQIPDLVPVLAALASGADGTTTIRHAERLRLKESDRLQTTAAMLSALGADISETEDGLRITGKPCLPG
ncbi:MAG: 3-phosphoshikimate 1-carboxyvinyltransferase, partial [Clostridia bacterium]|nr:3-phosphoshikimate 1-carboxyvinyltransferase [Clostridia bacterium]